MKLNLFIMSFYKYPSIENCNKSKYINKVLSENEELEKCKFVVEEKIDGANIQLKFNKQENKEQQPFSISLIQQKRGSGLQCT